ncbi:tripartite motif-containing protein 65-like [Callorhinchus milii]|uniref:tripartite motif-containing protein 65-like n=1 Tax=Callorhinchus milii TaxID=7868 RepID=UPI001C3F8DCA|nr:tripartite motif-containing protein 65-like [Callorhinchus milii]
MASATPSESVDSEMRCSICLGTFVCPSTLSCGHSFCLRCLEAAWKTASSFSCPQCRATFPVRPQLKRNVALDNLAEQLRVGDAMATAVVCDICSDGQTPAVKTCLRCEMSYCFSHFRPHLGNPRLRDHAVVDPSASLDERRCPNHSRELEFYCTVDSSLVCSTCTITGEHAGHKVLTLKDEHETRKTHVQEETRAVEEKRKEVEESVKQMEAARKEAKVKESTSPSHHGAYTHTRSGSWLREPTVVPASQQESVAGIRGRITGNFTRLRKALDEDEREALRRLAVKERELLSRIEEEIARHEQEISELQAAAARLRTLLHERDSLAFLQGHLEETRRREIPKESAPPPPTSLDATTIRSLERAMHRLLPLVWSTHHPHRFEYWPQALCSESFSSGQHYWEVDVGSARLCRVGVAYGTIPRRGSGSECVLGVSYVSWCLQKDGNSFSVMHGGVATSLSVPEPFLRVGVHLDWDAGLLSFYSADSMAPLHSFHQTFTQSLHPGLAVWDDSVRIVDLSAAMMHAHCTTLCINTPEGQRVVMIFISKLQMGMYMCFLEQGTLTGAAGFQSFTA